MSVLIVVIGQRPVFKGDIPSNVSTEDACGIQACLDKRGIESYIQTSTRVKPGSTGRWKTTQSADWNEFDELLIFNQELQFFGGAMSRAQRLFFNQICAFKGKISYFLSDPLFYDRNELTETIGRLEKGNLVNPVDLAMMQANEHKGNYVNAFAVHPNLPYVKSLNPVTESIEFIDQIRESVLHIRKYDSVAPYAKLKQLYYAGIRRPERIKTLKRLKDLLGSQAVIDGPAGGVSAVSVPEVTANLTNSRATIILGDIGHRNVGINHRLLQGMKCRTICFIDRSMDPAELLIRNEELKHFLYCNDMDDVARKFHRLNETSVFEHFLKLQDEEIQRIQDEPCEELVKRVINDEADWRNRCGLHWSGDRT